MHAEVRLEVWRVGFGVEVTWCRPCLTWNPWSNQFAMGLEVGVGFILASMSWDL